METSTLVFGSSSPFRKKVIDKLKWPVSHIIAPKIDEKAIRSVDPRRLCRRIAKAKALAVAEKLRAEEKDGFVITFDQVAVCNGEIREKPVSKDQAFHFLRSYNDYPAETYSAVTAYNTLTGQMASGVDHAIVNFHPFTDKEICRLIKHMYTMECAGAFVLGVEEFDSHVDKIVRGTRESIIGLPVDLTRSLLRKVGYNYKLP